MANPKLSPPLPRAAGAFGDVMALSHMSALLDLIDAFAAQQGVVFSAPQALEPVR